jgi:hypothetical protein
MGRKQSGQEGGSYQGRSSVLYVRRKKALVMYFRENIVKRK